MKLTPKEKRILATAQYRADAPLSVIAKLSGYREHTVRHCINSLLDRKLIEPFTLINVSALGFSDYAVFFSFAPGCSSPKDVLAWIQSHEAVGWVGEVAGEFEHVVLLSVRDITEVAEFFAMLSERFGEVMASKSQSTRLSWCYFPRKHLLGPEQKSPPITISRVPTVTGFDELDHQILRELSSRPGDSRLAAAKRLGIPQSTLQYRVSKLVEKKVIAAFVYSVTLSDVGAVVYRLLLDAREQGRAFSDKVRRFSEQHPNVVGLTHCVGSWDYEVRVELARPEDLIGLRDEIRRALGKSLHSIRSLAEFNDLKWSMYPFAKFPFEKSR